MWTSFFNIRYESVNYLRPRAVKLKMEKYQKIRKSGICHVKCPYPSYKSLIILFRFSSIVKLYDTIQAFARKS